MPLEEIRATSADGADEFPVGMRVLAVDDDPTCLMVLGGLLRKCQYQVTTTTQAKTALEMLREDRKRFDLIISDVYMPDMDGFRLLELIGLEMDLPVIMLSGNSEPKLVMKGINHGAVDYLVKPVRIEELRNIWQHVIRRKKIDSKTQNKNSSIVVAHRGNQESKIQEEPIGSDQRGKQSRKRKEEEEVEEEEESEENGTDSEDPSSHKKPRVVWSADLHQKFVDAVKQLGMKNAVPKRILETMNVEGISRENVASHLQKYRSYLKRVSSEVNHQLQANMMAAYRQESSSYLPMNALNGLGEFPIQSIPPNILSPSLSSYQTNPVLARLNTPSSVTLQSLSSSSSPTPLQVQTNPLNSSRVVFSNRPFLEVPSSNPQPFTGGFNGSHSLGNGGYRGNWQNTLAPSNLLTHTTPLCEPFGHTNQSNMLHFPSSNQSLSATNSMIPSCVGMGQLGQSLDQNDGSWGRITDSSLIGHSNIHDSPLQQFSEMDKLESCSLGRLGKDYNSEQMKQQGGLLYNNGCDISWEGLYDATTKGLYDATTKPAQETMLMNPVFGFGAHSFSS